MGRRGTGQPGVDRRFGHGGRNPLAQPRIEGRFRSSVIEESLAIHIRVAVGHVGSPDDNHRAGRSTIKPNSDPSIRGEPVGLDVET
jgi:hypothetical protein